MSRSRYWWGSTFRDTDMIGIGGNNDEEYDDDVCSDDEEYDDDDVCCDDDDPWDPWDGNWEADIYLFSLLIVDVEFMEVMLGWTCEIIFDSYWYINFELRIYFIDW